MMKQITIGLLLLAHVAMAQEIRTQPSGSGTADTNQLATKTYVDPRLAAKLGNATYALNRAIDQTGVKGMKKFLTNVVQKVNSRRINVRGIGTSLMYSNVSGIDYVMNALAKNYGQSQSRMFMTAYGADQPVFGWKSQFYGGTYSIRSRGNGSEGAATYQMGGLKGKQLTLFYSTEPDGGTGSVTLTSGASTTTISVNYNGASSYGNAVTFNLDSTATTQINVGVPSSGSGYIEYMDLDAGDKGVVWANTAWGGSALGNHAGTSNRTAGPNMATTPVVSGTLGLAATFAPTDPHVRPDLVIYSGATNDNGDTLTFRNNLITAITAVVSASASAILVMEPINGVANPAIWRGYQNAMYYVQSLFPDNVFVYNWHLFMSPDGSFNPKFHSADIQDPHPQEREYGNPHVAMAADFATKLGIPLRSQWYKDRIKDGIDFASLATLISPKFVGPIGINTNNPANGVSLDVQGTSRFGTPYGTSGSATFAGFLNLVADGSGQTGINLASTGTTGSTTIKFGNTTTNGKQWMIEVGDPNVNGGNGTGVKEGNMLWKTVANDYTHLTFDGTTSQMAIGQYGIHPSAQLQVVSSSRGFLMPTLSTTQRNAISSPADGLQIYNTTTKSVEFYNNTTWTAPLSPSNNLSDLSNVGTARTNLGLGTMAQQAATNVTIGGGTATLSSAQITNLGVGVAAGSAPLTFPATTGDKFTMYAGTNYGMGIQANLFQVHANSVGDDIAFGYGPSTTFTETARIKGTGKMVFPATNTPTGTTGNRTINNATGTVNIAAGGNSVVVTNSLVTTSSLVFAVIRTADATADIKNVVPGAGSFTINLNSNATAETSIGFIVFN